MLVHVHHSKSEPMSALPASCTVRTQNLVGGGEKQERLCRYPVCVFSFAFRFCNRLPLEIFNSSAVPAASAPSAPHVFFCAAGDASAPESAMLSRTSTGRTYPRGTFLCARFIETRTVAGLRRPYGMRILDLVYYFQYYFDAVARLR